MVWQPEGKRIPLLNLNIKRQEAKIFSIGNQYHYPKDHYKKEFEGQVEPNYFQEKTVQLLLTWKRNFEKN